MRPLSLLVLSISIQLSIAGMAGAQTARSCDEVRFKAEVVERYPDARKACQAVVERDGAEYVEVRATVQRATTLRSDAPLRVRVEGLDRTIDARPPAELGDRKVRVDQRGRGARISASQLRVGDRLTVLIPLSELEEAEIDRVAFRGGDDEVVVVEATEVGLPDVAAGGVLPKTASPWPTVGTIGMLLVAAAGGLRLVRRIL